MIDPPESLQPKYPIPQGLQAADSKQAKPLVKMINKMITKPRNRNFTRQRSLHHRRKKTPYY